MSASSAEQKKLSLSRRKKHTGCIISVKSTALPARDGSIDPRGFSPTAAHLGEISANFSAGSEIKIVAQRLLHETERKMVRRFSLSSRRHLHYYFLDK